MAIVRVSDVVAALRSPLPDDAAETNTQVGTAVIGATGIVINDIFDMCILPAGCVPVDVLASFDDLDTGGPTVTIDCGLIAGQPGDTTLANRTIGSEFFAASTAAQAGTGNIQRMTKALGMRMQAAPVDRSVGFKIAADATTDVVGDVSAKTNKGFWKQNTIYATDDYITLPNGAVMYVSAGGGGASGVYADPNSNVSPTAYGPAWQVGKGLTTTDGALTWTCISPVLQLALTYKGARSNF